MHAGLDVLTIATAATAGLDPRIHSFQLADLSLPVKEDLYGSLEDVWAAQSAGGHVSGFPWVLFICLWLGQLIRSSMEALLLLENDNNKNKAGLFFPS